MERSLTILLPVHNVQSTLAKTVQELLEVVGELTEQFELLIVDDGSADATSEVAHELARRYPQVRTLRHGRRLGREAAVAAGLEHSTGELVFVPDDMDSAAAEELRRLWYDTHMQPATAAESREQSVAQRTRLSDERSDSGGYLLIDRRTASQAEGLSRPTKPVFLGRLRKFALGE